jgi:hypothetical protein
MINRKKKEDDDENLVKHLDIMKVSKRPRISEGVAFWQPY